MMKRLTFLTLLLSLSLCLNAGGKRILFIGDSITDGGWGKSGGSAKPSDKRTHWDMNHIYGHSYMFLCAAHYQAEYPERNYEFFNRGISGNTLTDLEKRWNTDVLALHPDVLSVLIGTNDVDIFIRNGGKDFDIADWEARYRALLDSARVQNPDLRIVLGAPFVAYTGKMRKSENYAERERMVRQCASAVKRIADDYNAIYLPYDVMFAKTIGKTHGVSDTYWIWDGIHPTAAGHKLMSDLWIKLIDKSRAMR